MAKISFENLAPDGGFAEVPDGYRNLNWDGFTALDDDFLEVVIGNTKPIRTGEAAAATDHQSSGFESPDQRDDFDLNSGYFTSDNARVKVVGFDDGERVATKVLTLDTAREFVKFSAQFDDIDEVRFTTNGNFAIDDLFIA